MIVFQTIPYTGWKSIIRVPYPEIASGIYRMRNVTVLIAIVSVAISILLILFISSSFTKGLQSLRRTTLSTQVGNAVANSFALSI
ncbi:hypothetical protein [Paenibacillus qinlingensis]|uniref:hypothetical protein n=1 Tax=Paenibacillus qinlingensis TaxID=1837343 RepID=UPI0015647A7B|nr:hypothetical protein [Paenibacillus qinlingensis]